MYSPKIEPEQVRELYRLKIGYAGLGMNRTMTDMVREALDGYISRARRKILSSGGNLHGTAEQKLEK